MKASKTSGGAGETFFNGKMAESGADQCADVVLAALRHHDRGGTPRLAVAILQYALLACSLVALIGSAVMHATDQ